MLKNFLAIPIHPDNEPRRKELFNGTLIHTTRPDLFEKHFCKYPVISFSLKSFEACLTFKRMEDALRGIIATLYKEHSYPANGPMVILNEADKERFNLICKEGDYLRIEDTLFELSAHLAKYHSQKCIVLIDEYDHPMDVAQQNGYYENARGLFAGLMRKFLKDNRNI